MILFASLFNTNKKYYSEVIFVYLRNYYEVCGITNSNKFNMRSKFKWIFTLLLAVSMQFSFAQEKTVTGVVSDVSGTLPGANVVVQGTTRGVQTDVDGRYSIKASTGEVLVFSFVGMADYRVTVGASNVVNATLSEGGIALSEVIVTGALGIKRTRDAVTSSQQVVQNEELTQAASPNAIQSLAGKVSGLQINTTNSGVNATTRIVLRGNRSFTGNNEALIVIDNAISSAAVLQTIAPELIESTNVIKGASGAALYGSDGSNGVIIVTTKRGAKGGKPVVSINSSIDFEEVAFVPQRQQRYGQGWSGTHVDYENGAWGAEMDGVVRSIGLPQADGSYFMAPYSPIKNNIKKFFQTGTLSQNGFSINAGDETGYAVFSANRQATDFVVTNDKLNRNSFLFKGGKKLGKWDVSGIANYNSTVTNTTVGELYRELLQAATNIPVESFSTPLNQHHWNAYYRSPYWLRDNVRNERRRENFSGTATINYELNKNINFNYTANIQLVQASRNDFTNGYRDIFKYGGGDHTTISDFFQNNSGARNIYGDFLANFNYDLTDKLNLKFNLGNNVQDRFYNITTVGGSNLTIPGLYTISNVESPNIITGNLQNGIIRQRSYAFFANVDLGYDDFIFLNLTGRNDWTSLLDKGNNNYFYPSAGISFVPTKAFDALENNDVLTHAKIAASYVRIGNNAVSAYAINNLYSGGSGYPFGNNNSFVQQTSNTNAFIRPEFYTTKDVTLNLEFFERGRLTLDVSAFQTNTKDLNTQVSASYASGLTRSYVNIGESRVKGIEVDLGFTPIDNRDIDLKWTNRLSFYSAKTTVLKVSDETDEVALFNDAALGVGIFAVKGEEFPLIKGVGYQRDDQGRIIIDAATGNPLKTVGYINLGKATPDYILSYNTAIDFKGFRLAAVMDYRTGHQFFSGTKQWLSWSGHLYDSAVTGRTGFVFPNSSYANTDPSTNVAQPYLPNNNIVTGGTTYANYLSYFQDEYANTAENFVLDATAFKVRELSLSYGFKRDMIERAGLTSLRLGVNARNPFMVLPKENRNYSDPEQSRSSGNDTGYAAVGQYPLTRTYGFSVNLTF